MAESDSFIQEVSEEVRRDKMYAVWRKFGPFLIAAVVLSVIVAAGMGWWESRVETRKAELGGALLAADSIDDPAEAAEAFLSVAESGEYAYPVLARLRAAAALSQAGQLDEAEAQYEAIKGVADVDERFRDLAELRIVMMRSETMAAPEQIARLGPLAEDGSAWRLPALEYLAAAHLRDDAPEQALEALNAILILPEVPAAAQGRARELIEAVEAQLPDAPADDAASEETAPEDGATEEVTTQETPTEDTIAEEVATEAGADEGTSIEGAPTEDAPADDETGEKTE